MLVGLASRGQTQYKDCLSSFRNSCYKDKTVMRLSHLCNGYSNKGKMTSVSKWPPGFGFSIKFLPYQHGNFHCWKRVFFFSAIRIHILLMIMNLWWNLAQISGAFYAQVCVVQCTIIVTHWWESCCIDCPQWWSNNVMNVLFQWLHDGSNRFPQSCLKSLLTW